MKIHTLKRVHGYVFFFELIIALRHLEILLLTYSKSYDDSYQDL